MRTTTWCVPNHFWLSRLITAWQRMRLSLTSATTVCCLAATLFFSIKANAQGSCPGSNCTSNDMTLDKVEIVQENGDPLPASCTPGQPSLSVKLRVTFSATAQTRYGFLIVGDLYVNGVFSQKMYQCYGVDYSQGSHTETLEQTFSWSCGTTLALKNVYTAWGNQAPSTDICTHLNSTDGSVNCTSIAPKCHYYADQSFVVLAPLAADFTSLEGSCTNQKRTWTFTSTTSGGKTPYSYTWDFGDGSSTLTTTTNPVTHDYATFGSKTVSLNVTDALNNTSSESHTISVTACCIPSTAPSSASADVDYFCPGGSTNLSASGGSLGTNATWKWYTGSCGGTLVGSGSPLSVSPTATTTYYVRAEGDCGTTTCAQVTVHVKTPSTNPTGATAAPTTICLGSSTNLTVSGGSLGTGASWKWYSGSCGGTLAGTGSMITVSPGTTTTYYVRAEGDCGNSACASVTVTVNPASVGGTISPSAVTICSGRNSGLLTLSGYVGAIVRWESSADGINSWTAIANTAATYTSGNLSGDIWFRAVVKSGVCSEATSNAVRITVQQPIANNTIAASQTICSNTSPAGLTGSTPTGGSGTYSYQWQSATTGSFSNITGANGKDYAPGNLTQTTQFRRIVTAGVCNASTSDPVTITISPESVVYSLMASNYCSSNTDKGTIVLSGSYPGVSYQLKKQSDNSDVQAPQIGTGTSLTWTGVEGGTYYVLGTGVAPTYCTSTTASATVHEFDCSTFYTLTQGYYGGKNGKTCIGTTPVNTIKYLLGATDLVVGSTNSVTVPGTDAGANKLNSVLPGGSTPVALPVGNCTITDNTCFKYPAYLTKQGKINNVLLSQTITLMLNTRWDGGRLLLFQLQSGWLTTQKLTGCGGSTVVVTQCSDGVVSSIKMNQNVLNYLGANNMVQDLLNLANGVLGGTLIPGQNGVPSYSDVNDAIDAINQSFDEGRRFLAYYPNKQTCDSLFPAASTIVTTFGTSRETTQSQTIAASKGVSVAAYPNPYTDKVSFTVESDVSGYGSLQVYNLMGQKVKTVYEGFMQAGKQYFTLTLPVQQRANLVYVLTVGGKQVTGKLLQLRK